MSRKKAKRKKKNKNLLDIYYIKICIEFLAFILYIVSSIFILVKGKKTYEFLLIYYILFAIIFTLKPIKINKTITKISNSTSIFLTLFFLILKALVFISSTNSIVYIDNFTKRAVSNIVMFLSITIYYTIKFYQLSNNSVE